MGTYTVDLIADASTFHFDEKSHQLFPCRCGETHTGEGAVHDYLHHECLHDCELLDIGLGTVMCSECGNTWQLNRDKRFREGLEE